MGNTRAICDVATKDVDDDVGNGADPWVESRRDPHGDDRRDHHDQKLRRKCS